ncbi:hypothetical protein H6F74_00740 [Trichocoleus sp. FACHB-90]|nr:hypothetical protein [Trichocoleus sp. FACHB-90]MBD1924815.1 hypothetical protein [Trichocoleus sp. FACHB-90]
MLVGWVEALKCAIVSSFAEDDNVRSRLVKVIWLALLFPMRSLQGSAH